MDEAGGLYHVINRGNYREWIFETEGAKLAFERTLLEASERAGWILHAFCIMSNHYHLALETPEGNLSEGMRWLQSVFAARFNRFRQESGHLFQGRFKSLHVEDSDHLAWLCHYIHLNPVRAGLCEGEQLDQYRWSSLWYLDKPRKRPKVLDLKAALFGAGDLSDRPDGRRCYLDYLVWLHSDQPAQKEMLFDRMSRGWAIGSKAFRKDLAEDERTQREITHLTYAEAREVRENAWESTLERCLKVLKSTEAELAAEPKSSDLKVGVATYLKQRKMAPNGWLAAHLNMGHESGVSRYVCETLEGARPQAREIYLRLESRI